VQEKETSFKEKKEEEEERKKKSVEALKQVCEEQVVMVKQVWAL
jgi:hypothetical protein